MEIRRALAQFVRDRPILWHALHPVYEWGRQHILDSRIRSLGARVIPSEAAGQTLLAESMARGGALGVGKIGGLEAEAAGFFLGPRQQGLPYPARLRHQMFLNVGLFPADDASLDRFCKALTEAVGQLDIMGLMGYSGEAQVVKRYAPNAKLIKLKALDPWYFDNPWSAHLAGKRVTVVSPFATTIERQYRRRAEIWPGRDVLPAFDLRTIEMPLSPGLVAPSDASWEARLERMIAAVEREAYDVLLIGAGGISILMAAHAKRRGAVGFHMGGPTQVLFGIRGRRWDKEKFFRDSATPAWVRPSGAEAPPTVTQIERGAYW
ncbi:hypothetical protein [Falsiroseomonas tokyonensis]|uniref:Uncharacterized protein n=1 Tax=Falsiroseomonas tokyonensis TaxID=430521 RepID=A0ABV7C0F1_9PROT|nr:hypothetical protein [Falsiroseomonas tokyonensis]MBU8540738.1 hypothetical protein [Falsiroseomonas tokyonensis]